MCVVSFRSCDIIVGDSSNMLLVLHALFRMRIGHYMVIPNSRKPIFKLGCVFVLFPWLTQ